ncbi:MAG TPA: tRNA uridine-5-carboxymethylaminomethyl(34) synthesis GTPase MnmE [Candidatus Eremiobacteraceae bacterium]|nr:tRNA uridine-5-carboxymethylaminomethyl(34) synthesis GTPase MnmE [Candidatus Eremiobacteraceae bacterium]
MSDMDTIAAVATPPGVSAVAIIRISGNRSVDIGRASFSPLHRAGQEAWSDRVPVGRDRTARLHRGWITDPDSGEKIDDALAVRFHAPTSYTGEDLVELHVHGGAGVVATCLSLVVRLGARLAGPGEFTKRAFLNGRLDLAQAEAVADLIAAESERASKAAAHRLAGGVGAELRKLRSELLDRLVEIEAHLDYPDEVPEPDTAMLAASVRGQLQTVEQLLAGSGAARVLRDGIDCVIAGPPNAGKSSLLNALLQAERAIVSDIPGTTRDIVEDRVVVEGVVLRLRDTAGLRRTTDTIEAEGVTRAQRAISGAQLVIAVIDASKELGADDEAALELTAGTTRIVLGNKLDIGSRGLDALRMRDGKDVFVAGSVHWPDTIRELREAIARLGWGGALDGSRALVANARHIEALTRARESLSHAEKTLAQALPIDLVSTDLRGAVAAYGEVTGDTVTEEVLDGIFARFCVGK